MKLVMEHIAPQTCIIRQKTCKGGRKQTKTQQHQPRVSIRLSRHGFCTTRGLLFGFCITALGSLFWKLPHFHQRGLLVYNEYILRGLKCMNRPYFVLLEPWKASSFRYVGRGSFLCSAAATCASARPCTLAAPKEVS